MFMNFFKSVERLKKNRGELGILEKKENKTYKEKNDKQAEIDDIEDPADIDGVLVEISNEDWNSRRRRSVNWNRRLVFVSNSIFIM